jgi:hypothetical protein
MSKRNTTSVQVADELTQATYDAVSLTRRQ